MATTGAMGPGDVRGACRARPPEPHWAAAAVGHRAVRRECQITKQTEKKHKRGKPQKTKTRLSISNAKSLLLPKIYSDPRVNTHLVVFHF